MDRALYDEHAQLETNHWWFVGRRAIIRSTLSQHLPTTTGNTIVDVGCGTGGMLPMLATFGQVTGIEGDQLAVEHCRSTFGQFEVAHGQIPHAIPTEGTLTLATAFDVIEHLDDDVGALVALRRSVRPGGTVAVTVPALSWLWSDHDRANGHRRRYTHQVLLGAIQQAGLEVRHASYFNTILLPPVAVSRLAQRIHASVVEPESDFSMPPPLLNRILTGVLRSERRIAARRGLPIGVSLIAIAERRL